MSLKENLNHNNSLFIVCPFCQLEYFLRSKFGDDIFFFTVAGGVMKFGSDENPGLEELLNREKISDIYLVNDISCNFIEDAIDGKEEFGLRCEKQLREVLKKHSHGFEDLTISEKKEHLAKSNILNHLGFLISRNLNKNEISQKSINFHGMITDKKRGHINKLSGIEILKNF